MLALYNVLNQDFYLKNESDTATIAPSTQVTTLTVQQALQHLVVAGDAKKITVQKLSTFPNNAAANTVIQLIVKSGKGCSKCPYE